MFRPREIFVPYSRNVQVTHVRGQDRPQGEDIDLLMSGVAQAALRCGESGCPESVSRLVIVVQPAKVSARSQAPATQTWTTCAKHLDLVRGLVEHTPGLIRVIEVDVVE